MDKKVKTGGKKMNPVVIVVVAVVVIGGLYYGATRWRQQQYINQLAKIYGGNAGLLGNLTGGNNGLTEQMFKDIATETAKEEAEQKKEDAKEAAKTPQDRFNETKVVSLTGNTASIVKSTIESPLKAVFGDIKPTLVSGNYMKQGNSFLAVFKIPRAPTSEDMNKLVEELTKNGYTDAMSTIEAEAAHIIMEKDGNTISVYYDDPSNQEVGVMYVNEPANN